MAENAHRALADSSTASRMRRVLFVPRVGQGEGMGHFKRCMDHVRLFGTGALLLLPPDTTLSVLPLSQAERRYLVKQLPPAAELKCIVLDGRRTPRSLFSMYREQAPVVGLDEGGAARDLFPYLIDTLPGTAKRSAPNITIPYEPRLHTAARRSMHHPFKRVLLSFGGEDPCQLSPVLLRELLEQGVFRPAEIAVVQGPLFKQTKWPQGVTVYKNRGDLQGLIREHDLVFTHFGLTCYEALALGVPVISFNPTPYHRRLSREAGFPEIGIRKPNLKRLRALLKNEQRFKRLLLRYPPRAPRTRPAIITHLQGREFSGSAACPLCHHRGNRVSARFPAKTYFVCSHCGMIYGLFFLEKKQYYNRDYFFKEYRKQYGRTYLQDFAFIRQQGRRRLRVIKRLWRKNKEHPRLLDIGCAYGPFLKEAAARNIAARGLDISGAAVRYVRDTLGISCEELDFGKDGDTYVKKNRAFFDGVSMWFVLEHFQNPFAILKHISLLLKPGGILAFSTPSAAGISARKNMRRFLEKSPPDHYTVWHPAKIKKQLAGFGFTIKKICITGHHGERFFKGNALPGLPGKWCAKLFSAVSRLFGLGDTFEVYAVKRGDAG
jgi:2-polyprenyl-3-methyl-5-hydroxy-6-metoxy-1,4-benzoquinol methylase